MSKSKTRVDDKGRVCTKCHAYKTWNQFGSNSRGLNGHTSRCRRCLNKVESRRDRAPRRLLRVYGLTQVEYGVMELEQDGKCKICKSKEKLFVDHCHETEKVRGLVCNTCNLMLGLAKDNPEILIKAAEYLKHASN